MKHILILMLLLLETTAIHDEESSCEVISGETCFYQITGRIKGKIFEQKRPFYLFYNSTTGSKDTAAMFMYANTYHCEEARGFICDTQYFNDTFSISVNRLENPPSALPCTDGNFIFSADGEKDISCKPIQSWVIVLLFLVKDIWVLLRFIQKRKKVKEEELLLQPAVLHTGMRKQRC
ncbi:uncharacterized protein LOC112569179 isoform X2 [Pomacea canaliculata]|uniref:uncharacterized protein LOC112569179 isoform X2 n=1 Tax=Pomacea canaliculata TaxID=400727 RepID=UPI000D72B281|nr:uncharacterized protein LOC112569179 isoform X2 [Pomacea canaliculata]